MPYRVCLTPTTFEPRSLKHREAGFSMLEVLISIVIISVLFAVLGQTLININRTQSHLDRYFQSNRDAFYSLQSLRTIVSGVTPRRLLGERREEPAFAGTANSLRGQTVNVFMEKPTLRSLSMTIQNTVSPPQLRIEMDEYIYEFEPFSDGNLEFAFLDRDLQEHAKWPPEDLDLPAGADDVGYKPLDLLPEAILLKNQTEGGTQTLAFRVDG